MADSNETGPMVAVRAFVDAFNDKDVDRAQAACADETVIIDDFPPHEWTGSQAMTSWLGDMARLGAEYGMSDIAVTLQEPRHVIVTGRRAYVVAPVDVRWLDDGKPAARPGSITMALRDGSEGWRISACAWTWD